MFNCPRCGLMKHKKIEMYEHFELDPPCIVTELNISCEALRNDYDAYCETFDRKLAESNNYECEGISIHLILKMVWDIKTYIIIQNHDKQVNAKELIWILDIAYSKSGRKIYENYDDAVLKLIDPDKEIPNIYEGFENLPPKLGGYPDPPPATIVI